MQLTVEISSAPSLSMKFTNIMITVILKKKKKKWNLIFTIFSFLLETAVSVLELQVYKFLNTFSQSKIL